MEIQMDDEPDDVGYVIEALTAALEEAANVLVRHVEEDPPFVATQTVGEAAEDYGRLIASQTARVRALGNALKQLKEPKDAGEISDGFHTFNELYAHRRALTLTLLQSYPEMSWCSKQHHPDDATQIIPGYFIVGMDLPTGQITYHYRLEYWKQFSTNLTVLPYAPLYDGHTSADVVKRLIDWAEVE